MKGLKQWDKIEIIWIDTCSDKERTWINPDEDFWSIMAGSQIHHAIGYYYKMTKNGIVLVSMYRPLDEIVSGVTIIPRGCIIERRKLSNKNGGEK